VNCHCCSGNCRKSGAYKNKNRIVQRYACDRCGKSFSESQPLDGLRVDFKLASQVVHLLCEGMGIRAISRFTGLDTKTVMGILETAGEHCARFLDAKIRNVKSESVQVDEIHGFVYSKPQNTSREDEERGEFFTYLSVDRLSKLIINWRVGKRNGENTVAFLEDLKNRMDGKFQLTTDPYVGYLRSGSVKKVFGDSIDYATERKIYGKTKTWGSRYFNPMVVVGIKRYPHLGWPNMKLATTCHAERTNLSVRIFTRRFTRKTLGYSKKLENLRHAVALFVCHFNFCRVHSAHKKTPAQAAGLTEKAFTITELLESAI